MAFGSFDGRSSSMPLAEINMVPLLDVMLVLLVIFIVTAPLLAHGVRVDLPKAASTPVIAKKETIDLSVRADGTIYWNGVATAEKDVESRLAAAAGKSTEVELHLRADRHAEYGPIAALMAAAARAGIRNIGFVTDPATP